MSSTPPDRTESDGSTVEGSCRRSLNLEIGKRGEDAAVSYLRRVGFRILRRNWSPGRGRNEIDIIAEQRGTIVFVEVKTRSPRSLRSPGSAVDEEKRRRIRRAAASFLARYREPAPHRFDVVSVFLDSQDQIREVALDSGAFE